MDKFNSFVGGGKELEKKEDFFDKGMFGLLINFIYFIMLLLLINKKIKIGVDFF